MPAIESKRLGDILNFKRGYDLPASKRQPGEYPVISSSGISGYHSEYKADGEGIVTGRYGTLGTMYYINGKYWPHNTALYVTDFKGNYPKYVYYLLTCLGRMKTSDKSTVPGVNRNEIHEVNVPCLPRNMQENVANALSSLDQKIDTNNKINAQLEAMAKTLYDYWFVQFDFPDENGKPYKSSGGKMVNNEALKREIPEGWECYELSDVIERIGTGLNPRQHFSLGQGSNYYVTIKSIDEGKILLDDKCDKIDDETLKIINRRSDLRVGDILFTSIQPVGITYLIQEKPKNWNINESVFSIRPNHEVISSEYAYLLLGSKSMKAFTKNASAGSIHKGIRIGVLKTFKFAFGGEEIVRKFSEIVAPQLAYMHKIEKENQELTQLRNWLLPMLMNGQVKVGSE
jgi:type I restriction enzyme S subunit